MADVLILGAGGRLGQVLSTAFLSAGWTVHGQVRSTSKARLPAQVIRLEADGRDVDALARAGQGKQIVIHAANPPYGAWAREAVPLADGALAAAGASGALLLFPGNVYGFGRNMPERLSPEIPQRPTGPMGAIRRDIEDRLATVKDRGGKLAVLAAGDFFGGPGRGAWFDRVIAADVEKADRITLPGPPAVPHAFAYLPDLAACFVAIARQSARLAAVERFHFPGHTATLGALAAAIEAAAGRPLARRSLPWGLMRLIAPFSSTVRALVEMEYLWHTPHRLVDERLLSITGPLPSTPFPQAVALALAELRQG